MASQFASQDAGKDFIDYTQDRDEIEGGVAAARGLVIGLALSQIFWIALAWVIFH